MTLDEAIQHALEVAEEYQLAVDISDWFSSDVEKCEKCANEHRQLAEWLNDYKKLKAAIKKTATELYLYQEKARENRDDIIVGECIRILREKYGGACMTIDEAVEILNKGYTPRGDREAFKQYFLAREMAIRSLEAWDELFKRIYDHHYEIILMEDSEAKRAKLSLSNWVLDLMTSEFDYEYKAESEG